MGDDFAPTPRTLAISSGQRVALRGNSLVARGLRDLAQTGKPCADIHGDVTPLTLGVETPGGIMCHLIECNTPIPTKRVHIFRTTADNQSAMTLKVYQGERQMTADNHLFAIFSLEGIPPAPRGVPQIEVEFEIDKYGILNVSAKDLGTRKRQTVRIISCPGGLSEEKIEEMRKDAHADGDGFKPASPGTSQKGEHDDERRH